MKLHVFILTIEFLFGKTEGEKKIDVCEMYFISEVNKDQINKWILETCPGSVFIGIDEV